MMKWKEIVNIMAGLYPEYLKEVILSSKPDFETLVTFDARLSFENAWEFDTDEMEYVIREDIDKALLTTQESVSKMGNEKWGGEYSEAVTEAHERLEDVNLG